ncbi:hypothetical protein ACJX0J_008369, partial [Zea mays]
FKLNDHVFLIMLALILWLITQFFVQYAVETEDKELKRKRNAKICENLSGQARFILSIFSFFLHFNILYSATQHSSYMLAALWIEIEVTMIMSYLSAFKKKVAQEKREMKSQEEGRRKHSFQTP